MSRRLFSSEEVGLNIRWLQQPALRKLDPNAASIALMLGRLDRLEDFAEKVESAFAFHATHWHDGDRDRRLVGELAAALYDLTGLHLGVADESC